jgi:hypothetical protein
MVVLSERHELYVLGTTKVERFPKLIVKLEAKPR